ncbi:hypothetical protein UFOVP1433_44 [uncultured Caudovirales phage]|uniref:Uncharacterized protein n=1 Tax=uncultured Caudovirales phage TaxID=2100421 RepID=A0A6J5QG00_9CAUD|nr:hypothetical protein UFOVP553_44 [uncultured Caudovirales phage]CAB4183223.1 hypothetical protein UFOVP1081_44 [uncultured Caudovirales phage]CAB4213031.1 hypothetical protein UFOVP1433_44 [uncultured Caudovirales phage]
MEASPEQLAVAQATAASMIARAKSSLAPLERAMRIMKWEPEYRAIMWEAVMEEAAKYMRDAQKAAQ